MPGASIVASQPTGAGPGSPGIARNDLWQSQVVNLTQGIGGNVSFLWEFLDIPPGSAAVLSTPTAANSSFTPDLVGTYRIRLTTNSGGPGNVQVRVYRVRYDNAGIITERGWALPAFGEEAGESNYGFNLIGWAEIFQYILTDIRTTISTFGFATPSYVYQFGGTPSGNIYDTWAAAFAAADAIGGLGVVEVDDTLGFVGTPTIEVANFDLRNEISIQGRTRLTDLILPSGSSLTRPTYFYKLALDVQGNTLRFPDTTNTLSLRDTNITTNIAISAPCIQLAAGKTLYIHAFNSRFLIDGGDSIFDVAAGATLNLYLNEGSVLDVDTISGAGTVNLFVREQNTYSLVQSAFTGTLNVNPSEVSLHVAAADPHTQYQKESEKGLANGYAGLDAGTKLVGSWQVYGTASNTATEGNDSRVPTQNENDALQGTDGSPSNANRYVTNSDPRNGDTRTPSGPAGGQLGGTYPNPDVRGIRETLGPTLLTFGNISDNQLLQRSSTTVVGVTAISDTQHGNRGGGSLHAVATTSVHGFMSSTDKTKLDGIATGAEVSKLRQSVFTELTLDTTTTSVTFVDLLTLNITTGANFILIHVSVSATNNANNRNDEFQVLLDGTPLRGFGLHVTTAGEVGAGGLSYRIAVTAAAHVVKLQWRVSASTGQIRPATTAVEHACVLVEEVTA